MATSILTPMQRYAAGALFGLALNQAQSHQTRSLDSFSDEDDDDDDINSKATPVSVSSNPELWVNETFHLLRPIFSFLEINDQAWSGLEETAGSPSGIHHVGAFIRLLADDSDTSSEMKDQEHGLSNAVSSMAASMDPSEEMAVYKERHRQYEQEWRGKFSNAVQPQPEVKDDDSETDEQDANGRETDKKDANGRGTDIQDANVCKTDKQTANGCETDEQDANDRETDMHDAKEHKNHVQDAIDRETREQDANNRETDEQDANGRETDEQDANGHETERDAKEHETDEQDANDRETSEQDAKEHETHEQDANDRETDEQDASGHEPEEKDAKEHETHEQDANDHETHEQDELGKPSVMAASFGSDKRSDAKIFEEVTLLDHKRKVAVLFELLTACLSKTPELDKNAKRQKHDYDARHRVALRLLSTWFDIEWVEMEAIETIVASSAMAILKERKAKQQEADTSQSRWAKWRRGGIIGAAALTGGTLMAITGGLAAPAIAAGFGALAPTLGTMIPGIGASVFAAAATAAGSAAGSVAVAASFGAAGAGLSGTKMARRTGSIDEFEFKVVGDPRKKGRLAVEMLISGFIFEEDDFVKPWEGQTDNSERYALQWESKHLIAVSTAIQDYLASSLAYTFMQQGAMLTVLNSLVTALIWPAALLSLTSFIDIKWSVAVDRSDKAGKMLAEEVLEKGLQGQRPVTLLGFSLGARVIFKCLQSLSESENNAGLIERVVLLGSPIAIQDENWEAVRKMVSGRFINAYSTNDWTLGVAFRASLMSQGLAGIQPVDVPGIENVDVTEVIEGHSSYLWATKQIIEQLELNAYYPVFNATPMKPPKDSP
ncbi:Transmembrane and coiled-coil domain-containing protein 4 [Heracleum sosnowskyi]|uniref:Transmembrane and coiled-coil domain-containing protein 4 n=1 Tax=Heracleum sosnowskyi TaxID=360622 RepID=A0AAD8HC81_9APIA|nr:Transmembrane and coiled-coil domain-containing protein 4 [Heracleum sosnowskyi]